MEELKIFETDWQQYNPRKPHIPRQGLDVFNYHGELVNPSPSLDSLKEYNVEHGTKFTETECTRPTEVYEECPTLKEFLEPMHWAVRTHFLKLGPGGYFPPHRDHTAGVQNSFRIIVPIWNCRPPRVRFMLEDQSLDWEYGVAYVLNTTKSHTLFNAGAEEDSIWLVINAMVCGSALKFIERNLAN